MVEVEEEIPMVLRYLDTTHVLSFEPCLIDETSSGVSSRVFEE